MDSVEFIFDGYLFTASSGLSVTNKDGSKQYLNYSSIIEFLHPDKIWLYAEDGDYQGNLYAVGYDQKGKFYFIQGSFGSCSGCDWLQSIDTEEEAIKLLNYYKKDVIEKPNIDEMITYLKETTGNISFDDKGSVEKLIHALEQRSYIAY
jgi:hypothetical protein